MSTPAVFLDRDGTLIHDVGYLSRPEGIRWYPWSIDAVRLLNRAGYLVVVVTNQGGVGLGLYDDVAVARVHGAMDRVLVAGGATVHAWFHCPHHPRAIRPGFDVACACRKPAPGMIRQATDALDIDLSRSVLVGDKHSDVACAVNAGMPGVLVQMGEGDAVAEAHHGDVPGAAFVARNLMEATSWVLGRHGQRPAAGSR